MSTDQAARGRQIGEHANERIFPQTAKPTKAVLGALEKVFAAEIDDRLPFQSKAAIYRDMLAAGLVDSVQRTFGHGAMAVTVSGYALTHRGRIIYCQSCREQS